MKRFFLIAILAFFIPFAKAQLLKRATVDEIKQGKIVVALTEDEALNKVWKAAIENRWNYTEIIDFVSEEDAFDQLKAEKVNYVLYLNLQKVSQSRDYGKTAIGMNSIYRYVSEGMALELRNGKRSIAAVQYIPPFGADNEYAEAFIHFGIDAFQYQFETIINNDLKNNMRLYDEYNKNGAKLKDKTLLVLADWLNKKITIDEAKAPYKGKMEFVPFADWKEAILTYKEGMGYVVVVPVPVAGKYIYLHYLMDAANGHVMGMGQPKVSFGAFGYSKGNSGFVNEKNIEIYNEVIEGN